MGRWEYGLSSYPPLTAKAFARGPDLPGQRLSAP